MLEAILEEGGRPAGTVAFCVDSTYAINVATGKWRPRPDNGELARRLRQAAHTLVSRWGAPSVRFEHVRAHTGEPGNEAADALAKAARVQDTEMCGATLDVLQCALVAYMREVIAKAGRATAQPRGQQGSQSSFRRRHVQPEVRREGFALGFG